LLSLEENSHFYLKKFWGYDVFRPLQKDIILSILTKNDTLALLPTGGGKSICFQVPALVMGGTCLVISPLIALMNDQVRNLKNKGISAVAITSAMTAKEIDIALNNAALGHVQFLYVSPERIENETFRQRLSYLPIGLIAVDEAHCISQWGYDFRPSYLKITLIREYFPDVKIIALTASATQEVIVDIQDKLQFVKPNVFKQSFERKNLRYVVLKEENKFERLLRIIKNIGGTGIIYVRNRKKTKEIAQWLISQNLSASFYHAGLDVLERSNTQEKWISNHIQIIVATNAFGMGIDKPDVRFVVHLDLPESLEAYFQEAGRGGRDLKPAYAIILTDNNDVANLKKQFDEKTPSAEEIKQTYQALYNFYQIPVESGEGLSVDFNMDEICRNYNLKAVTVYNSIKSLEIEGYISYLDNNFEPSKLMFLMAKEELYNFQLKYSKYEPLIKVLLRSYGGLYEQFTHINEKDVAYRTKISEVELQNQLNILNQNGVINFIPQSKLPKLIFLRNRINLKFSSITLTSYETLKQKGIEKLDSVVNYVSETKVCRSRLLLSYFNENNFNDCGYCDVCVEKNKTEENIQELYTKIKELLVDKWLSIEEICNQIKQKEKKIIVDLINKMIDEDVIIVNNHHQYSINKTHG
jgi:ATP-dependent DNA helicase RecQ